MQHNSIHLPSHKTLQAPANDNTPINDDISVQKIAGKIKSLYTKNTPITDDQALMGAHNLINYVKSCVDIYNQLIQNQNKGD